MDIVADVQGLIGKYGLVAVRGQVEKVCKETYEELKKIYCGDCENREEVILEPKVVKRVIRRPKVGVVPEVCMVADDVCEVRRQAEEVVREEVVVCEETCDEVVDREVGHEEESQQEDVKPIKKYVKKTDEELKQIKANHRAAVLKKYQEHREKGIDPHSFLNKENLEKWLGMGLSYQRIAREHVGIHENIISSVARAMGLKSAMSGLFPARRF
jgi:hypothetical protein